MAEKLILTGPRTLEFRQATERKLEPNEVRLKSIISGISHGTELNLYRGTAPFFKKRFDPELRLFMNDDQASQQMYPTEIGYENICLVTEKGDGVTSLNKGDICHTYLPHGEMHIVDQEWTERWIDVLPEDVSIEEGIFVSLSTIALIGVHDAGIKVGDEVAIMGLGTIGLILAGLSRLEGAKRIIGVDPIAGRRDMGKVFGCDEVLDPEEVDVAWEIKKRVSSHKGVDVALETSGSYTGLQASLRSVRMAGRVVTLGYYQGSGSDLYLGEEWHHNRLNMISSMGVWDCPHRDHPLWDIKRLRETVLHLMSSRKLCLKGLITHRIPFREADSAYRLLDERPKEAIKVALVY